MTAVSFSVVVVCHNNVAHTVACIESLFRHAPPDSEIIVVDNASSDGTRGYLTEVSAVAPVRCRPLFRAHNEGWCRAINIGFEEAEGDYLVMLNNDVVVTPNWLEGLRDCMEQAPSRFPSMRKIGLVGPVTNFAGGPQQVAAGGGYALWELDEYARQHRAAFPKNWGGTFFLSGFCMMVARACFEQTGGLDERFSPGGYDDNDLVLRAQEKGWDAAIAGDVYVHHEGSATFRRYAPEKRAGLVNRDTFMEKWRERRRGPKKLVAVYRVKNAAATIRESLDQTAAFADAIVVLDDGSSDETSSICREHPAVTTYERQDLGFDERRDRNRLLELAADLAPDWVISIDADEIFEMSRERAQRLMHLEDPHVRVLGFHWYTFWEPSHRYFRSDGIFGGMSGLRMYRFEPGQRIAHGTENGLHCGNIPQFAEGAARYTNVRVRHLGYDSQALREAKYAFYREKDPHPDPSLVGNSDYRHLLASQVSLAQYPEQHGLSLSIITKNEEERLGEFLSFFQPFVDEICVVDTGSTDRTITIAKRFTDKVESMTMDTFDLAKARNRSIGLATQPWILSLDPDEAIVHDDMPRLQRLLDDLEATAYSFHVRNHQKGVPPVMTLAVRLFRNDKRIFYTRPVHETVEQSLAAHRGATVKPSAIAIEHYGYLKPDAQVEGKIQAYFERNKAYRMRNPEDPLPWFNEALHHLNEGREEEAVSFLTHAMRLDQSFISPRSQLAYLFQERAMRLWQAVYERVPPEHPLRSMAAESASLLRQMTPPRPQVGLARTRQEEEA